MLITGATNRIPYAGNGVTLVFAVPFKFMANSDIVAELVNTVGLAVTPLVQGADYNLTGAGVDAGGSLTMVVAPPAGYNLVIYCDPAVTQPLQLVDTDNLPSSGVNSEFDRATIIARRALDLATRSVRMDEGQVNAFDPVLPINPTPLYVLAISGAGDAITVVPSSGVAGPPGPPGPVGSSILVTVNGGNGIYTILPGDQYIRTGTALTAPRTYTMSPAAAVGEVHRIKNLASQTFNLTVAANGAETIDGLASIVLAPGLAVDLICGAIGKWEIL